MATPTIGDHITDFVLLDRNGEKHKLSEYNNKFMLLGFWSVTCMVCMKAAQDLKKLHESHGDKLNIVSINMDIDEARWEQGTQRDKPEWPNLSDGMGYSAGVGKEYGIVSYPAYVLVNNEGIIIDRWMGFKPGKFEEKMEEHLNRK